MEKKLNAQTSAIPESNIDYSGIDDSIAEVKAFERMVSRRTTIATVSREARNGVHNVDEVAFAYSNARGAKILDINFAARSASLIIGGRFTSIFAQKASIASILV